MRHYYPILVSFIVGSYMYVMPSADKNTIIYPPLPPLSMWIMIAFFITAYQTGCFFLSFSGMIFSLG